MIIKEITIEQVLPIRQIVMYPDQTLEELTLPHDHEGIHLGAFDQAHQLVSVVSLFKKENDMQFRKFATLQKEQGKGYGKQLLSHILEYSKVQQITRVWCNARVNALGFYTQFGFKETNQTYHQDGYDFVIAELFL
ncbi:GNAT family N-acetyltransferase [Arcticibacter eurypsychrophilus]|uniref:GNAT family N-acetyltransferase n=1 Tax=Arcticibacter eurypsychrophilus TaxID=1434752 RepID=UPI00084D3D5D|nr:GNAT family N-acetyltransferase [Arcticibacter eurypsychrophilus]